MDTSRQDLGRFAMWTLLLGEEYAKANPNQKRKMKRMYADSNKVMSHQVSNYSTNYSDNNYNLGNCVPTTGMVAVPQQEKKMELEIINATSADSVESQKIRYLKDRAYTVYYTKQAAMRREFGLDDDPRPTTVEDLVERIKAGTYTVRDNADEYYNVMDMIKWRDPSKKTDLKGFKTAYNKLDKELKAVLDTAAIGNPAEGLAAIQKWEDA